MGGYSSKYAFIEDDQHGSYDSLANLHAILEEKDESVNPSYRGLFIRFGFTVYF